MADESKPNIVLPIHVVTVGNFAYQLVVVLVELIWNILLLLWDFIDWFGNQLYKLSVLTVKFLGPVSTAVAGKLNRAELYRVVSLAATTGTGFFGFIQVMKDNMDKFITDEYTLSFSRALINGFEHNHVAIWITLIIFGGDLFRRIYHKPLVEPEKPTII
jgi:hypothetical protein